MRKANVCCRGIPAGVLSDDEEAGYQFQYRADYLNSPNPPISLTLPKQEAEFRSPVLFPYFFGLLAEGEEKSLQCRIYKIDENDSFSRLLKTCETETIGGVTVSEVEAT
jgi:serine/threonine-protein kinase HipA